MNRSVDYPVSTVPNIHATGPDSFFIDGDVPEPALELAASAAAVVEVDLADDPMQYRITIGSAVNVATLGEPDEWFYDRRTFKVVAVEVSSDVSLTAQNIGSSRMGEAIQCARRAFTAWHANLGTPTTRAEARRFNQTTEHLFASVPPEGDTWRVAKAWHAWNRAGRPSPMRPWIAELLGWDDSAAIVRVKNRMAAATRQGWIPPAVEGSKIRGADYGADRLQNTRERPGTATNT